jgi:enamine deaminase RidA (YjgF/YER057c/UK114 family)
MRVIQPEGWPPARGYSHAWATEGEDAVFLAGCTGTDHATGALVEGGMAAQAAQALRNLAEVATAAGSSANRLLFLRIYITDRQAYMDAARDIGRAFREVLGDHLPAMTFLHVSGLFDEDALIEIDGVAAVPR